jgi:Tol biopolymer transport system component
MSANDVRPNDLSARLSRELPDLLTDIAAPHVPEYADDLLARLPTVRQRPRWSFVGRWLPARAVLPRPAFASALPTPVIAITVLLLLALALAAIFVGSQRRLPPPFGLARPGAIAYVADGEIWRANADGTGATQLTHDPRVDTRPVFSRDGTKLAITRLSEPGSHPNWEEWSSILITDIDGGHPVLIDDDQEGISPITWSSDGRFIVYSKVVDGYDQIVVALVDGSSTRVVTSGRQSSWGPVLAPDDLRIAFADGDPAVVGVSIVDVDGSNRRPLVRRPLPDFDLADWSPDGRRLVYAAGGSGTGTTDLWLVDVAAGTERPLVATADDQRGPVWSPDGGKIAYLDESDPRGSRVIVVGVDGVDPHAISAVGGWTYPQWSPDAHRVIATDAQFGRPPTVAILDPSGHDPAASLVLPDVTGIGRADQPTWQRLAP